MDPFPAPGHMDAQTAQLYAAEMYGGHPAASALILEANRGDGFERRVRSARALVWLDPLVDVLWAPCVPGPLEGVTRSLAEILAQLVLCPDRQDRLRVAGMLRAHCREAERLNRKAEALA